MKKYIKQFVLICTIICIFSYNSFADTCNDNAYYILKDSTVTLQIVKNNGLYGCTGIIIHEDETSTGILTAQHCVNNADKIYIDSEYLVTSIQASSYIDVAYIVIDNIMMHKNAVKIAKDNVHLGESMYTLGYPGFSELYSCGVVLSKGRKSYISSSVARHGCSGSGVINIKGELIGILWGGYFEEAGNEDSVKSIITNIELIIEFLESINFYGEVTIEDSVIIR